MKLVFLVLLAAILILCGIYHKKLAQLYYTVTADQGDVVEQPSQEENEVQVDKAETLRLWKLAAEQGDPEAQFNLGGMYDRGDGVPVNKAEAVRQGHLIKRSFDLLF